MLLDFIPALEFLGRPIEDAEEDLLEFDGVQLEFEDDVD